MIVLVTGASGYLGRALTTRLARDGMAVRGAVRRPEAQLPAGVQPVMVDLQEDTPSLASALAGCEAVVHCAAHLGDGARERFRRVNVDGTRALLDAAARAGVRRFVHVSSIAVYGWAQPGSVVGPQHGYDPCPELRDDYAWSKIEADRWAALYSARGLLDVVTLRPGIIYGGGRDFVARMFRAVGGKLRVIFGSPRMRVPLVHVSDVVDAIARAIAVPSRIARAVNVVGPDCPTQAEYLSLRRVRKGDRMPAVYVPVTLARLAGAHAARRTRFRVPTGRHLGYCLEWATQEASYSLRPAMTELDWSPSVRLSDGLAE
jgi:UDP-glucose 4-epimerase